jgi:hypothetical protein
MVFHRLLFTPFRQLNIPCIFYFNYKPFFGFQFIIDMVPFLAERVFQEPPPIVSSPTLLYWSPIKGLKTFLSVLPKMVNAEVISREENKHRFQDIVGCQTVKFELMLFNDFFRDPQLSI